MKIVSGKFREKDVSRRSYKDRKKSSLKKYKRKFNVSAKKVFLSVFLLFELFFMQNRNVFEVILVG